MIVHLCIKFHTVTGLKYFCKTTRSDPLNYMGSGLYWKRHIKVHGWKYIRTMQIWTFDNIEYATAFALKFSKDNNIVESRNWANLQVENALDGGPSVVKRPYNNGENNPAKRAEVRQKISDNNPMKDPLIARKLGDALKGVPKPWAVGTGNNSCKPGVSDKISKALTGVPKKKIICPHCNKEGGTGNMKRYHMDNCKSRYT